MEMGTRYDCVGTIVLAESNERAGRIAVCQYRVHIFHASFTCHRLCGDQEPLADKIARERGGFAVAPKQGLDGAFAKGWIPCGQMTDELADKFTLYQWLLEQFLVDRILQADRKML
jgi:hypothetical protein